MCATIAHMKQLEYDLGTQISVRRDTPLCGDFKAFQISKQNCS